MAQKQINIRLSEKLAEAAENYAENYGFKNIQELLSEALREKVFEENKFDETFTQKEIELIEEFAELTVKNGDLVDEKEIFEELNR